MANLREFTHFIHEASDVVLESLSDTLQLPKEKRLWHFHNIDQPSPSILRLLKYHPQPVEERGVPHISHTDMGAITFLFTRQPGLQVLSSDGKWTWVAPRENCAIVNVGDMLAMLTSDVLRSCPHRVGPLPGQAMPVRYSFAYMVRAASDTYLAPLLQSGPNPDEAQQTYYTCLAWLKKKYGVLRLDTYEKSEDWMLTGRKTEAAAV
jgi:isopenicillin N synthase-like dioxygenase